MAHPLQSQMLMARRIYIKSSTHPYHCYNRVQNKLFYPKTHMPTIWKIYQEALLKSTIVYGARIHLFLLMSNHYHLLVSTPDENLSDIMMTFQSEVSLAIRELTDNEQYKFSSRYKRNLILSNRYFAQAYKYITQNPIEEHLCKNVEEYPYSSLSFQMGNEKASFEVPIFERQNEEIWSLVSDCMEERLIWLNSV